MQLLPSFLPGLARGYMEQGRTYRISRLQLVRGVIAPYSGRFHIIEKNRIEGLTDRRTSPLMESPVKPD